MFDLNYFHTLRNHAGETQAYFAMYLFAVVILSYAALWDKRQHRVPNLLWVFALIPVPASLVMRDLSYDSIFLPALFVVCLGLRFKMSWGTGDAKAIVWLGLLLGALPAIFLTILAIALTGTLRKKDMGKLPFIVPLSSAAILSITVILVWLH